MTESAAEPLISASERDNVLASMAGQALTIKAAGEAVSYVVTDIVGRQVRATVADGEVCQLTEDQAIEIGLGLRDGEYLISTYVTAVGGRTVMFAVGDDIRRRQRRKSFRAAVPPGEVLLYRLQRLGDTPLATSHDARLLDLSTGGALLLWPAELPEPEPTIAITGLMSFSGGRQLELGSRVWRVGKSKQGVVVGVGFIDPQPADEQLLLAVCLELQSRQPGPD